MELREYLVIIQKRFWVIFSITLLTTVIAAVVSYFILHKVYEANTTIYVGKQMDAQASVAYQELLMGQTLVKDYREIAKSRFITQTVKQELQKENWESPEMAKVLELSDQTFSDKISVNSKNDTRIIEIKVTDTDPAVCTIIANKVATVFKDKAVELLKVENIQIIDRAIEPIKPIKPQKSLNIAIALLLGLMASLGVILILEYFDNTIKTPEDVTKYTELNVIGVIPKFELIEGEGR